MGQTGREEPAARGDHDIPALDANIRNVSKGGTSIRILYQGLSREQIDSYVGRRVVRCH